MITEVKEYYVAPIGQVTEYNVLLNSAKPAKGSKRFDQLKVNETAMYHFRLSGGRSLERVVRVK